MKDAKYMIEVALRDVFLIIREADTMILYFQ